MGHSGWVGFDMYCEYSDLMSARNSRIYSNSRCDSRDTEKTTKVDSGNAVLNRISEDPKEFSDSESSDCDDQSDMTDIWRNPSDFNPNIMPEFGINN